MDDEEVLLRETDETVSDLLVLECSNCGFKADHYFFYDGPTYANRKVLWCPNCRRRILGIAGATKS